MSRRSRFRSNIVLVSAAAAAVLALGPLAGAAAGAAPDHADAVEVYEHDVSVIVGSTLRDPTTDTAPDAPLFNDSGVLLEASPGVALTWGDWSKATGASTVKSSGGASNPRTDVRLELSGLIPGGRYSIFWGTLSPDSEQPLCPGVERTLPLDATHPAQSAPDPNSFVVGPTGEMAYRGQVHVGLLDAGQVFFSVVYHAFGQSSYPFPNIGEQRTQGDSCRSSFGEDSMRWHIERAAEKRVAKRLR